MVENWFVDERLYVEVSEVDQIMAKNKRELAEDQAAALLETLKKRFEANPERHEDIKWTEVELRLKESPDKLWSLHEMEKTGGEPDVVSRTQEGSFLFHDCSPESPEGRRNLCFDQEALEKRRKNKPEGSAMQAAQEMGIAILSEEEYRELQELFPFDLKTSTWVQTPDKIRRLGGALFCDRRYDTVFVYHNGADSYYGARGFRGKLEV